MKRACLLLLVVAACGKKDEGETQKTSSTSTTTATTTQTQPQTQPGQPAAPPASRPSQGKLDPMPALQLADDPKRKEKIELGHALFFDKRLSGDGSLACISCHENKDGNGGHDPIATGAGGQKLTRHAPVLWNVAYFKNAFAWDGRLATLEDQVKGAMGGKTMGVGDDKLEAKAAELAKIPGYKALFDAAYPGEAPSFAQLAGAIAAYEQTFVCNDTAYDKYVAGDKSALSEQQQRGLDVFLGKGVCTACHTPPLFSSAMGVDGGVYFNVGVGTQGVPEDQVDVGRMKVTSKPEDWAAFKPPSLRNVGKSAPYFHDGSAATLDDALKVMAGGGIPNKNLTPVQADRKLTAEEMADLKAFLGSLDCPGTIDPPAKMP